MSTKQIMRLSALALVVSSAPLLHAQVASAIAKPDVICADCGGGTPPGRGGGTPPGGGGSQPQAVYGFNPTGSSEEFSASGVPQREGVGATVAANTLFVAYKGLPDPTHPPAAGVSEPVYLGHNFDGQGQDLDPGLPNYINYATPNETQIVTTSDPALASDPQTQTLYMAVIDSTNTACIYTATAGSAINPQNGVVNWIGPFNCVSNVIYSPSLAYVPNTGPYGQGTLYMAMTNPISNSTNGTLVIETMTAVGTTLSTPQTNYFPDKYLGFNPGLGVFNSTVYVGIQAGAPGDSTHDLYYWKTTDGQNLTFMTTAMNDQTSAAPSLAVFQNVLYMGFRTNDSSQEFIYKFSLDGTNWTTPITGLAWQTAGTPRLVDGSGLTINPPNSPHLLMLWVGLDQNKYVYGAQSQ